MKKLLLIVAACAFLYSCGPSADEKAKMEQARQDSINAAQDMMRNAEAAAAAQAQADTIPRDTVMH